ncbi:MAG TPA: putative baseplate assembly protein [Pyrinomonadaceae bacterium]|jgi:hypothetical protein
MSIALTNLDDRRWLDLVDEGRALIPFYSPGWTDHNVHDPGITFIELFAWLAEMDIYQLNRIPDRHLLKFIKLLGIHPEPPQPAIAVLNLALPPGYDQPVKIPRFSEFDFGRSSDTVTRFRTMATTHVVRTNLQSIQFKTSEGFQDLTEHLRRGEEFEPFGSDPDVGSEFYLGFSQPLSIANPVSLLFISEDLMKGRLARNALIEEQRLTVDRCGRDGIRTCNLERQTSSRPKLTALAHHSVRLAWQFSIGQDQWQPLRTSSANTEVDDDTRSLTLNGRILFRLPGPMHRTIAGKVKEPLYYLRAIITRGVYDAAPRLRHCSINGVLLKQAAAVGNLQWAISPGARIRGRRPSAGRNVWLSIGFDQSGEINGITFAKASAAVQFRILKFQRNEKGQPGLLQVELVRLGLGDGLPNLRLTLPDAPVLKNSLRIFTLEDGRLRQWSYRQDFDASGRADAHFTLQTMEGVVSFGDGERGRVVPNNVPIYARYDSTRAALGNLSAGAIANLSDTPHNRALLGDSFAQAKITLEISNPLPATGGADLESLSNAIGRAIEAVSNSDRAVTLADYESLAMSTPGTKLARVAARANVHPSFPCLDAQGIITVIALPHLHKGQPSPGDGLKQAIASHLFPRRVIGTRVQVIGPRYKTVFVIAKVKALGGADKVELKQRVIASLNRFFHPLTGGQENSGWPFGGDVFRSEVLQVIDETDGVDHVSALDLASGCGEPQCGNICLSADELVAAGDHQIEIV